MNKCNNNTCEILSANILPNVIVQTLGKLRLGGITKRQQLLKATIDRKLWSAMIAHGLN